jgi:hypothetical protein
MVIAVPAHPPLVDSDSEADLGLPGAQPRRKKSRKKPGAWSFKR